MAHAAGSLARPAPVRLAASQAQKPAPAGSAITARRPAGGTSKGSSMTEPPAASAGGVGY
jgi:hypothetical protein